MDDKEIITLLGGPTSVARLLGIKPPSVLGWITEGKGIPEGRLIELAATIEARSGGRFSRVERWPESYARIWPELAQRPEITPGTEVIAPVLVSASTTSSEGGQGEAK